jgi:hypothetical protein
MTSHDDIAALRKRLAKTESDVDTWRAAGPEEKYLAAYFAVDALELQLYARLRAKAGPGEYRSPQEDPDMTTTSRRSTSNHASEVAALPRRRRLMARLDISHDGLRYWYNGYRYDRLTDAVSYALLTRARPGPREPGAPHTQCTVVAAPSDADRALMASLAIEFDAGAYRFGSYRYDRLADAVNYARSAGQRQEDVLPLHHRSRISGTPPAALVEHRTREA